MMSQTHLPTSDEVQLVTHGNEERYLEYKSGMNWSNEYSKVVITKAMIALSNIRDGGYIVIGVHSDGSNIGINLSDAKSFKHDDIANVIKEYTEPPIQFTCRLIKYKSKYFVVLKISEFLDCITVCKKSKKAKDHRGKEHEIKAGHIYYRPLHKSESVDVVNYREMRTLLELAVEKEIQKQKEMVVKWLKPILKSMPQKMKSQKKYKKAKAYDKTYFEKQLRGIKSGIS